MISDWERQAGMGSSTSFRSSKMITIIIFIFTAGRSLFPRGWKKAGGIEGQEREQPAPILRDGMNGRGLRLIYFSIGRSVATADDELVFGPEAFQRRRTLDSLRWRILTIRVPQASLTDWL